MASLSLIDARTSFLSRRLTRSLPRRVYAAIDGSSRKQTQEVKVEWIRRQLAEEELNSTLQQRLIVAGSFGLNFCVLLRGVSELGSWNEALGAVSLMYAAYLTADLLSGVYHWSIDNYGTKETPVFGKQIDGFQRHHQYPWTITYRQFCNNISPVCLPAIPFSALLLAMHPNNLMEIWASVGCMMVVLSQQCHAWAHTKPKDLPEWVQQLQNRGILVSPKMHCQHHRSPFAINYCIVSGIWNPFLDSYSIFRKLEALIFEWTGVKPRSWEETSDDVADYFENDCESFCN